MRGPKRQEKSNAHVDDLTRYASIGGTQHDILVLIVMI